MMQPKMFCTALADGIFLSNYIYCYRKYHIRKNLYVSQTLNKKTQKPEQLMQALENALLTSLRFLVRVRQQQ